MSINFYSVLIIQLNEKFFKNNYIIRSYMYNYFRGCKFAYKKYTRVILKNKMNIHKQEIQILKNEKKTVLINILFRIKKNTHFLFLMAKMMNLC